MTIRTSLSIAVLLVTACISSGVAADTGTGRGTSSFSLLSISGADGTPGISAASYAADTISESTTFTGRDLLKRWHTNTSFSLFSGESSSRAGSLLDPSSDFVTTGPRFSDFLGNAMENYDPSKLPGPQQLRRRAQAIRSAPLNCFM
jgi:hypothetical protein